MGRATLFLVVLGACGSSDQSPHEPAPPIDAPPVPAIDAAPDAVPSCITDGDPLDEAPLRERLAYLASKELAGRASGSPGEALARAHVAARFRCLDLVPAGDDGGYIQLFDEHERHTGNVIGYIPGIDPVIGNEVIVIGAHMDHVGTKDDKIWYGANDNGSGTTAMLAVAQLFAQRAVGPRRTVMFVGFGAEETGLNGSQWLVDHMPPALPLEDVVYMINLDMVGTYTSKHLLKAYGAFPHTRGRALLEPLLLAYPDLKTKLGGHSERSDDAPFCTEDIPYVFFFTDDPPCYHRPCDTPDRIDYHDLSRIAGLAAALGQQLADDTTDLAALRETVKCGRPRR